MSEYDFVKSARSGFSKNKGKTLKQSVESDSEDDNGDVSTFQVVIDIKVKKGKNKKNLPPTTDILNWCGNILSTKS